jgi:hypothetical protein
MILSKHRTYTPAGHRASRTFEGRRINLVSGVGMSDMLQLLEQPLSTRQLMKALTKPTSHSPLALASGAFNQTLTDKLTHVGHLTVRFHGFWHRRIVG